MVVTMQVVVIQETLEDLVVEDLEEAIVNQVEQVILPQLVRLRVLLVVIDQGHTLQVMAVPEVVEVSWLLDPMLLQELLLLEELVVDSLTLWVPQDKIVDLIIILLVVELEVEILPRLLILLMVED
tara:strand:+ start:71 stop:448 length:378 start_codon:yes stop_codon:yes gene_type:complete